MSTSPSLAVRPDPSHGSDYAPFPYAELSDSEAQAAQRDWCCETVSPRAATAERASQIVQARAQAQREGYAQALKEFEERLARERSSVAAALAQFTRDRAAF